MKMNKACALLAVLVPAALATGVAVAYDAATETTAAGTAEMNDALDLLIAFLGGPSSQSYLSVWAWQYLQ